MGQDTLANQNIGAQEGGATSGTSRKKFWRSYKTIAVFCAQHILHSVWSKHRIVKMADDRDKATDQMKTWKANRGSQVCICIGLYQVILLRGGYHSLKWVKGRPGVTG